LRACSFRQAAQTDSSTVRSVAFTQAVYRVRPQARDRNQDPVSRRR
jgi:hypothetical protein